VIHTLRTRVAVLVSRPASAPSIPPKVVSELLVTGQGGCETEEGEEVGALSFVSEGEPTVAEEPGDRPFDLPAVPAEPFAGLDTGAGDARDDVAFPQPGQVLGGVVRLVRPELGWAAPARSATGSRCGYPADQRLERVDVVGVGRGDSDSERDALSIGDDVQFAAILAAISRIPPGQRSPFFARTEAASTIAEVQSNSPLAPNSSRTLRCSRRHRPSSVHAANRRCAVAGDTPNVSGRCRQAHPLVSTYTTAVNAARSSTGAVPPPCGRGANDGSNGATSPHSSSGTSRCDRSIPTSRHHAAAIKPT
jgi:hypothetical protein